MSGSSRLQRRVFLKALAAGLSLSVAAKMSKLVVAAPTVGPKRLVIVYLPHGMPPEHFDPGSELALTASGPRILDPLAPFADVVTVLRGVHMNDGASGHPAIRALLTGFSEGGAASSIDATIADALGTRAHVLGVVPYASGTGFGSSSFLVKHGDWVCPTADPVSAASALLGDLGGDGPSAAALGDEAMFRAEALALGEAELEDMAQTVSGLTSEENKLAVHLSAIRKLKTEAAHPLVPTGCKVIGGLPALDAARNLAPLDGSHFRRLIDAQLEIAAASIVCNSARVITLQTMWAGADVNFGFAGGPGIAKEHHQPVSHSMDAAGRAEFAVCQRWLFERIADKLISALAIPDPFDPDHRVLDNTLVMILSEVSDGAYHNSDASRIQIEGRDLASYLPCVLIGRAGLALKTGRVLDVDRSHIDVLASAAAAMDVPLSTIGGQDVLRIEELFA